MYLWIYKLGFLAVLQFVILAIPCIATSQETNELSWQTIAPGYQIAHYYIKKPTAVIAPEIVLAKFSPSRFAFRAVSANELVGSSSDLVTITRRARGIAGINSNFFDIFGKTLGLLISDGKKLSGYHKRGNVLTGLFIVTDFGPQIVHRNILFDKAPSQAIQAGPRLIESRKAVELSSNDALTRRSGVAINGQGEVIIYATVLRFPGVSLRDIQEMLLKEKFDITDALNLDGGGSSQLCIEKYGEQEDIFITGGDKVPAGLVVVEKELNDTTNREKQRSSIN